MPEAPLSRVENYRVNALERLLQVAATSTAKTAAKKYEVRWLDALPLQELSASAHAKLRNFTEKRLPRWIADQDKRARKR